MYPDSKMPSEAQRILLCDMLHDALVGIRNLATNGRCEEAFLLADAFHNLPQEIWRDYFSIAYFRETLEEYAHRWSGMQKYVAMLDEVDRLDDKL